MAVPKAGERLRCPQCGTEVVVVRAPGDEPKCCGQPLLSGRDDKTKTG
ncbi:MAG TPA: hypothetical protein VFH50_01970 [Acidimicrobiales bacterium]|nr:hypothetical protein [Acidimicrobiales bacterium]